MVGQLVKDRPTGATSNGASTVGWKSEAPSAAFRLPHRRDHPVVTAGTSARWQAPHGIVARHRRGAPPRRPPVRPVAHANPAVPRARTVPCVSALGAAPECRPASCSAAPGPWWLTAASTSARRPSHHRDKRPSHVVLHCCHATPNPVLARPPPPPDPAGYPARATRPPARRAHVAGGCPHATLTPALAARSPRPDRCPHRANHTSPALRERSARAARRVRVGPPARRSHVV
jgi:hypothetical protein